MPKTLKRSIPWNLVHAALLLAASAVVSIVIVWGLGRLVGAW